MQNDEKLEEKSQKTAVLLGIANLLLSPLYLVDTRLALTVALIANTAALYQLHELGKRRRPGSNIINSAWTFFSAQADVPSLEINNSNRNIINGGAAVFDELISLVPR